MEAAGARHIETVSPIELAGWHLLGTARMGTDPTRSIVNEWRRFARCAQPVHSGRKHLRDHGGANPTSTLQALALYIADQMKQRLANLFD